MPILRFKYHTLSFCAGMYQNMEQMGKIQEKALKLAMASKKSSQWRVKGQQAPFALKLAMASSFTRNGELSAQTL